MTAASVIRRRSAIVPIGAITALAVACWALTVVRMRGMDAGPNTDPGSLGFFLGVWVAMMAAMMLPSSAPMVKVYADIQRSRTAVALFAAAYLGLWTAAGLVAYALAVAARRSSIDFFAWNREGRYAAAAVLVAAALYQLTPLKQRCLARCRTPLGFVTTHWRDGASGAIRMGSLHGAWCLGCCWALMASLFALGVMSVTWMVLVALLVAVEKLLPWEAAARLGTAAILTALAIGISLDPAIVPGLTVPAAM